MPSLRTKIVEAMKGKDWLTSNQICHLMPGGYTPEVSKTLHNMVNSSIAESRPSAKGKRREFKLITRNVPMERGTVRRFIEENPGLTADEISNQIPCRKQTVLEYVRNALRDERISREKNDDGDWVYTMIEDSKLPFGMQNPTRFMFEQLLKSARNNKQISCN